ncbi:TPA: hypothetical protein P0V47_003145 [Listeria innocua]|nr:hypothetical protein [Listeria innocua]HDM8995834.1 hypothetical protein [Listeria innocua]
MAIQFTRFSETIRVKEDKRVVNITIKLFVTDCTGTIYYTDVQLQEGDKLTGYVLNTETSLEKYREESAVAPVRFYNGVVRSKETIVIFNLGTTSAGLDCHITPLQSMKAGSIKLSQGYGSHHMKFKAVANPDDTFSLLASSRQALRNQSKTEKEGFYQYTAASDSKHIVELEEGKAARVLFEFQELQEGSGKQ